MKQFLGLWHLSRIWRKKRVRDVACKDTEFARAALCVRMYTRNGLLLVCRGQRNVIMRDSQRMANFKRVAECHNTILLYTYIHAYIWHYARVHRWVSEMRPAVYDSGRVYLMNVADFTNYMAIDKLCTFMCAFGIYCFPTKYIWFCVRKLC